jgi:hypothetical protein
MDWVHSIVKICFNCLNRLLFKSLDVQINFVENLFCHLDELVLLFWYKGFDLDYVLLLACDSLLAFFYPASTQIDKILHTKVGSFIESKNFMALMLISNNAINTQRLHAFLTKSFYLFLFAFMLLAKPFILTKFQWTLRYYWLF